MKTEKPHKFTYQYSLVACLPSGRETIEEEIETKEEAEYLQGEYRLAFGCPVIIKKNIVLNVERETA